MAIFLILIILALIGIGAVVFLLKSDGGNAENSSPIMPDGDLSSKPQEETFRNKELGVFTDLPPISLKDVLNQNKLKEGTATLKTFSDTNDGVKKLSKVEEIEIEKEIELSTNLDEVKNKYDRLDMLFKEKSEELAKAQSSLDNELKNRKEFNKVKDILEKELSDYKDKLKKAQSEAVSSKNESEAFKKQVSVLESKAQRLEKDLVTKEHEVDDLLKRLQTFASPVTAHVPPQKEEPKIIEAVTLEIKEVENSQLVQNPVKDESVAISLKPDVLTPIEDFKEGQNLPPETPPDSTNTSSEPINPDK